jgi:hypothetical protein
MATIQGVLAVSATAASLISAGVGFVGGLVSSSVAEYLRTHRENERERLRLRAAARLVDEELRNAHDAAVNILEGRPFARLSTSAWDEQAVRLAATLTADDWRLVARAYDRIGGYNWRLEAGVLENDAEQRRASCEKIIAASKDARAVLQAHV